MDKKLGGSLHKFLSITSSSEDISSISTGSNDRDWIDGEGIVADEHGIVNGEARIDVDKDATVADENGIVDGDDVAGDKDDIVFDEYRIVCGKDEIDDDKGEIVINEFRIDVDKGGTVADDKDGVVADENDIVDDEVRIVDDEGEIDDIISTSLSTAAAAETCSNEASSLLQIASNFNWVLFID